MTVTAFRRGESTRNTNRNNSRNDGALRRLTNDLHGQRCTTFYYQYCGNFACAYVTAIMTAHHRGTSYESLGAVASVGAMLSVPVLDVAHEPHDETIKQEISLTVFDGDKNAAEYSDTRWRTMALMLRDLQIRHQEKSDSPRCTSHYEPVWGDIGRGRGRGNTDLSLSNMIRSIPGVRHLDVDAVIVCEQCNKVEAFVEASSDGADDTRFADVVKATRMTRKLARRCDAFALLVQHHVNDDQHEYPVQVTGWEPVTGDVYRERTSMTWQDVKDELTRIHQLHLLDAHR